VLKKTDSQRKRREETIFGLKGNKELMQVEEQFPKKISLQIHTSSQVLPAGLEE